MSDAISFNYEEVSRRLNIISKEYDELLPSLNHLKEYVEDAYQESNLTFLRAIADVLGECYTQTRKITGYVEDIKQAARNLHGEVERYAAGE